MKSFAHAVPLWLLLSIPTPGAWGQTTQPDAPLRLNEDGYYERPGLNVMLFDDFYPEGHQGGLTIIQSGTRVAANGDIRLEPTPGQWSPVPKIGPRRIDREAGMISVDLWYPDSSKDRKGFNPILYPDLRLRYTIRTTAEGNGIRLTVDLHDPLPVSWGNKVGFNLELFPGHYFGEHYLMDSTSGVFPRQANGPMTFDREGELQITPLAVGKKLVLAPGIAAKEMSIDSRTADLQLIDGRGLHNNGWFVLRSTIPAGVATNAVEWLITPAAPANWRSQPTIQVSQIGYHPKQNKFALIELEKATERFEPIRLLRFGTGRTYAVLTDSTPAPWGKFLRYKYLRFDFSTITKEGIYTIQYGDLVSHQFEIRSDIFARHIWQPTLEYFLPVQMCHMRINDRYKVWHGLCHMDDAQMAPLNHNHFDGYFQHESTLTTFASGEHVPGLNTGGWHDAGDYDLRVESQAATVYKLALAYEPFDCDYDVTTIDQESKTVEMHRPDGRPDILEQIEHGLYSILGAYGSMGRLYRGIICPTLGQYVHLGDAATMSDNLIYRQEVTDPILHRPLPSDDRWVFTEENPQRELYVAQTLAAANRVLKQSNPGLAGSALNAAEQLYAKASAGKIIDRLRTATELYVTTGKKEYATFVMRNAELVASNPYRFSEVIGTLVTLLHDSAFTFQVERSVATLMDSIQESKKQNPYGVPYKPYIWGAGWGVQSFGVTQLFLHLAFPRLVPLDHVLNALNFVLGCHPGENTASFVSGVGVQSLTVAYGANRDEWSYIPGGVASGTALIRPDFPELKVWPYFWQQTEYVMGGGATDFMLLAMAADKLLNAPAH